MNNDKPTTYIEALFGRAICIKDMTPEQRKLYECDKQKRYANKYPEKIKNKHKAYQELNKEKISAYRKQRYQNHKEYDNLLCRLWYQEHKEERAMYSKRRSYGLSKEAYYELMESQDFRCAICGVPFAVKSACVDHDHNTGKVRGLTCHKCNMGMGHFNDDPELIKLVVEYLEKSRE